MARSVLQNSPAERGTPDGIVFYVTPPRPRPRCPLYIADISRLNYAIRSRGRKEGLVGAACTESTPLSRQVASTLNVRSLVRLQWRPGAANGARG
jgi:hypothetical protein